MHTETAILDWLVAAIARETQTKPEAIDPSKSIHALGIDSALVISLTFDLEDTFGLLLDPTTLFQPQSLRELARQLSLRTQEQPPAK
jgi:acyl carrier protein